jgi:hypothetical protein
VCTFFCPGNSNSKVPARQSGTSLFGKNNIDSNFIVNNSACNVKQILWYKFVKDVFILQKRGIERPKVQVQVLYDSYVKYYSENLR